MRDRNLLNGRTPLTLRACKTEAERLFALYLAEFRQAPEASSVLHKQYFSTYPFEKEALQNDVIQIVRRDFIWNLTYTMIGEDRLIGLARQPASLAKSAAEARDRVARQRQVGSKGMVKVSSLTKGIAVHKRGLSSEFSSENEA